MGYRQAACFLLSLPDKSWEWEGFMTELTRLQRKILRLLGMPKAYSG